MNGAAIISTADGAIPEFVRYFSDSKPENPVSPSDKNIRLPVFHGGNPALEPNGFEVPYFNHEPTPEGFLAALEGFSQECHDPQKLGKMIRSALHVTPLLDVKRTVIEMEALYKEVLGIPIT